MGSYRQSSNIASTSVSSSSHIINFTGFKPSGISYGNIMGVALYVWSGSTGSGDWVPLEVGMLK